MSYATLSDLENWIDEDELVQLTDDDDSGTVDTDKVDTVLEAASMEIDGYLGERYDLPLASVPGTINKLCCDIAIYNLYTRRQGPPDYIEKKYDNAVRFLEKVAAGKISLGASDPEGTGTSSNLQVSSKDREFTEDVLDTF